MIGDAEGLSRVPKCAPQGGSVFNMHILTHWVTLPFGVVRKLCCLSRGYLLSHVHVYHAERVRLKH